MEICQTKKGLVIMGTKERYERVREELDEVCRSCGRQPDEVTLVAVSKTVGPEEVANAVLYLASEVSAHTAGMGIHVDSKVAQAN